LVSPRRIPIIIDYIYSKITRVISLLAKKTKTSRDGRRGVCSILIR
jgi:hypothetical protein